MRSILIALLVACTGLPSTLRAQAAADSAAIRATALDYIEGWYTGDAERQRDVTILDGFRNAAVVKVVARDWIDYLQVAKWNGEWKIVNVPWEMRR